MPITETAMRHIDHSGKRDALISIMTATYHELQVMEAEYGLSISETDLRPRIEYFHDAVRVLTHRPEDMYLPGTRLSVEHLAYDMSCLRYIQSKPLTRLSQMAGASVRNAPAAVPQLLHSPGTLIDPAGSKPATVPPTVRAQLVERYRSYTVMYAALFAEPADMNFQARQSENDSKVEDMAQIEQMVQMLEQGKMAVEQVEEAIQQVEDVGLRTQLMAILHQKAMKKREKSAAISGILQQKMEGLDLETKSMDKAHMQFLSGQMVMYQDAKDLVRKLSAQGMAMAGRFLEDALSQASGRGTGQGR